ncbi:MAG: oligoendopeptidase F [Planctomycetia bacterium]|nr:oligoendopeptidase F [Planctomycetia bacterium]
MKSKYYVITIIILSIMFIVPLFAQSDIPQRSDIDEEYKWNLNDIYPNLEEWEKDYQFVESNLGKFDDYRGNLGKSGDITLEYFRLDEEISKILENLYVYAYLNKDSDTRVSEFQGLADRAAAINIKYGEAVAFVEPELQKISEKKLQKFISKTDGLKDYQHYFDNLIRQREHTLSSEQEELLAMAGELYRSPSKIFEALTEADLVFPIVVNEKGDSVRLTRGRYYLMLLSTDQEVRRRAFLARTEAFDKIKNTNAAVLSSSLKKDLFLSRVRKYNSTIEMALGADNVPVEVYDNLLNTVYSHVGSLNKYMELRKKVLGLEDIHLYDAAVPIVEGVDVKVSYEEAKVILEKAFQPLGDEYIKTIKTALNSRWIDVYETEGKATGAYSWGTYTSHPYMLMNYNGTMDHMFTLAHELGHAMHSYQSNKTLPYATADYPLFLAEVASTFNENLLLDYLMKNTDDKKQKLVLLDQWINNFLGTVFAQVIFGEFERNAHKMVQEGSPITVESLNKIVRDIDKKWYGDTVVIDDGYALNWGRISHYYRTFYVYKYATSFCASTALAKSVLDGKEGAIEKYMTFLQSGGSDYPIEILKKAGVDMSSPEPIEQAMQLFDSLVIQMEELLLNP